MATVSTEGNGRTWVRAVQLLMGTLGSEGEEGLDQKDKGLL